MVIISSEFCDVDAEHDGPAVMKNVNDREQFLCSGCWQKKYPDEKFPIEKGNEQIDSKLMESPYWKWVKQCGGVEPVRANPDKLASPSISNEGILFTVITRLVNWEARQVFTPQQHKCFMLIINGFKQKQIAKKLKITQGRVSKIIYAVKEIVKQKYYEYGGGN